MWDNDGETEYTEEEWLKHGAELLKEGDEELAAKFTQETWDDADKLHLDRAWESEGIFLTQTAALKFMKANAHHLVEPRTYVKHFWRNSEMDLAMEALAEFSGVKLGRK